MPNAQCTRNDAIRGMHGCFRKLNPHVQDGDDESYGGSSGSFSKVSFNVVFVINIFQDNFHLVKKNP
jgi:hypothetical protein